MVVDRRAQLVDAGVELLLRQRFQDLLASVDTRSITNAAGVTTGSFFHHFRNRAAFTEAVIERLEQRWEQSTHRSLRTISSFAEGTDFRSATANEWARRESERVSSGLHNLLLAVREQPVSEASSRTAGDVLASRYRTLQDAVRPAYRKGLEAIGREVMPPFTDDDLAVALTAIGNGLGVRSAAEPGALRRGLYADLVSALVIAITRPVGEQSDVPDLPSLDRQLVSRPLDLGSPSAGSATWRQIAEAAAPLFIDRRVGDVKVAEIAHAAGVSPSTVYHQFGRVSAVAAAGWTRHLPELEAIATRPLTADEGPIVRMEQVLTRYIQLARESRGALEGLVQETVAVAGVADRTTAVVAPVSALLVPHVRELRTRGLLRRRVDSIGLARSIMQLTAMRVLTVLDEPVERVIDDTLGMLLDGALVRDGR